MAPPGVPGCEALCIMEASEPLLLGPGLPAKPPAWRWRGEGQESRGRVSAWAQDGMPPAAVASHRSWGLAGSGAGSGLQLHQRAGWSERGWPSVLTMPHAGWEKKGCPQLCHMAAMLVGLGVHTPCEGVKGTAGGVGWGRAVLARAGRRRAGQVEAEEGGPCLSLRTPICRFVGGKRGQEGRGGPGGPHRQRAAAGDGGAPPRTGVEGVHHVPRARPVLAARPDGPHGALAARRLRWHRDSEFGGWRAVACLGGVPHAEGLWGLPAALYGNPLSSRGGWTAARASPGLACWVGCQACASARSCPPLPLLSGVDMVVTMLVPMGRRGAGSRVC